MQIFDRRNVLLKHTRNQNKKRKMFASFVSETSSAFKYLLKVYLQWSPLSRLLQRCSCVFSARDRESDDQRIVELPHCRLTSEYFSQSLIVCKLVVTTCKTYPNNSHTHTRDFINLTLRASMQVQSKNSLKMTHCKNLRKQNETVQSIIESEHVSVSSIS